MSFAQVALNLPNKTLVNRMRAERERERVVPNITIKSDIAINSSKSPSILLNCCSQNKHTP